VAYWVKVNHPQYSVLWVPALSNAMFEQAYTEIAKKLGVRQADDEDIREVVRQYLSSDKAGPWLLIVDNADDNELVLGGFKKPGLVDYLPQSEHGLILVTTRSQEVAERVTNGNIVELGDMNKQEALDLLTKSVRRDGMVSDDTTTATLLQELAYLPLAITQAAAYLRRNRISVVEYLQLLRGTEQDLIGVMSTEFHDNGRYRGTANAVATTWLVSFNQIRRSDAMAAELLMFMSYIEPKAIPQSILPSAESRHAITQAIGTLYSYTFLSRRGQSCVYDMHSLVHLATRVWIQKRELIEEVAARALRHVAKVFPTNDHENRNIWREYIPHALKLVQGSKDLEEKYYLYYWIGRCLQVDGRIREAVDCLERCCSWREAILDETHPDRLSSEHALALAYADNGQVAKAVALLEKVVEIRRTTVDETHPDRLGSEHNLALAYQANSQVAKAATLLEKVVEIRRTTLDGTHPSRLGSEHALAFAYADNGQVAKAVALLEKVVEIYSQTLDETHPSRLRSEHNLANAYADNGQVAKAVALLEKVVEIHSQTLDETHPDRLGSEHALANAYADNGQVAKAVALL